MGGCPMVLVEARESYPESRGVACGSIDMREFLKDSSSYPKPTASSSTSAGAAGPCGNRVPGFLPEIRVDEVDDINLENYSTSPRKYQDHPGSSGLEFDAQVEVEARFGFGQTMPDVTLPVKKVKEVKGEVAVVAEGAGNKREAIPDIAHSAERKQPDGQENNKHLQVEQRPTTTTSSSGSEATTCSGMLDRISHDLDYLLNRTHPGDEA